MRGTVAKRIRREVYGESSLRASRRYAVGRDEKLVNQYVGKDVSGTDENGFKEVVSKVDTGIRNLGLRAAYQRAKHGPHLPR